MKISLARWCHQYFGPKWGIEEHCKVAKLVGADGIELAPVEEWGVIQAHGLKMPLALVNYGPDGPQGFERGWNEVAFRPQVTAETRRLIQACKASNGLCNLIIAFSGNKVTGQDVSTSIANCAEGMGVLTAELTAANVRLAMEGLNTKVNLPMRGHPGYEAFTQSYARTLARQVGPTCTSLCDVYHRQIEEGDVIGGINRHKSVISHFHVAGLDEDSAVLPRAEMNTGKQVLNWKAIGATMTAEVPDAWVGVEYIPTEGRDYVADLRAAIALLRGE